MYQAYTTNGLKTEAPVCYVTSPVIINALVKRILTQRVLQNAHALVVWAFRWPNKDKLKFEVQFSNPTRDFCHIFTTIGEFHYYIYNMMPSISKEVLKKQRRMPFNLRSSPKKFEVLMLQKRIQLSLMEQT